MTTLAAIALVAGLIPPVTAGTGTGSTTAFEPGPGRAVGADIVYPPAPEIPRIRLLSTFQKTGDFRPERTGWWARFTDFLMGREKERGAAFAKPYGIAVAGGKAYIADTEGTSVAVLDLATGRITRLGDKPDGKLASPIGVAVDAGGTVYVTDSAKDMVNVYGPDHRFLSRLDKPGDLSRPTGVVWDGARNRILVADTGHSRVVGFSPEGEVKVSFGRTGSGEGTMGSPVNIAVGADGTIYVVDPMRVEIQAYSAEGKFRFQFGERGNSPGYFMRPRGVAVDSDGNIYVVDAMFGNVQVFDSKGRVLMFFGDNGVAPGLFQLPAGISIDEKDRVFVVDSVNRRVQVFQYLKDAGQEE